MSRSIHFAILTSTLLLAILVQSFVRTEVASAVTAADWRAGNIIDDSVFTNKSVMTVSQIQSWLNTRLVNCDYWGTKTSELSGGIDYDRNGTITRAEYGRTMGNPAPFTCLNNYYEVPKTSPSSTVPANNYGTSTIPAGAKSAAQLIYDAAQAYNISPKVLLVKLGTESAGPLTNDPWPFERQYLYAMGAHCPDSGPGGSANCDSDYAGFSLQMREAAKLLRWYLDSMTQSWWSYKTPYQTNYILWNVSQTGCGGSNVYITNKATAALYTYTPYQPNSASLSAYPGTGNSCSSYGNRNFWFVYSNWFGSTYDDSVEISRSLYRSPGSSSLTIGDTISVSFIVKNASKSPKTLDSIGVAVRDSNNNVVNFPFVSITLQPGESYTYYQSRTFDQAGTYRMWIANLLPDGTWSKDWPYSSSSSIRRSTEITLGQLPDASITRTVFYSPSSNPANASTEDITAASFKVTNNESSSVTLPEMSIIAIHESGSIEFYPSEKITLSPGEEHEYYQYKRLTKPGKYTLVIHSKLPSGRWSSTWPASNPSTLSKQTEVTVINPPSVSMTRTLYVSPAPLLLGQKIGASFVIKNNESTDVTIRELAVRGRDTKGREYDFPSVTNLTLSPGESYTYYQYRTFDKLDTFLFYPIAKVATDRWTNGWPKISDSSVRKFRQYSSRLPKITLSRSLYHSPGSHEPSIGQTNAVSFVVRNDENRDIVLPAMLVAVRDKDNKVVNFPIVRDVSLHAGESYTYYQYRKFDSAGEHRLWIAAELPWGGWSRNWPSSIRSSTVRSIDVNVKP